MYVRHELLSQLAVTLMETIIIIIMLQDAGVI